MKDDPGPGDAPRAAAVLRLRPWEDRAVRIRGVDGENRSRLSLGKIPMRAEPLYRPRESELRSREPLDEVTAP
jgi:hypothetical protein